MNRSIKQKGVASIFAAFFVLLIVTVMFLAFNVGQILIQQKSLNKLASMASLDGSNALNGCLSNSNVKQNVQNAVNQSITNNGGNINTLTSIVTIGQLQTSGGLRTFLPQVQPYNAVQVTLTSPMPALFGAIFHAQGNLTATYSAKSNLLGIFYVGDTLVSLNTLPTFLGPLLNNPQVSVSSYTNLADVSVPLADLKVALGLSADGENTPASLANVTTPLPDVINSLVNSLANEGQSLASSSLSALAQNLNNSQVVQILNLINDPSLLSPTGNSVQVNVLQLLETLAEDVSNPHPILLNPGLSLPAGIQAYSFVEIASPAQFGGGFPGYASNGTPLGQEAETSSIILQIRATVANPATLLGGLIANLLLGGQSLNVGYDINLGKSTGILSALSCPNPNAQFNIDTTSATTVLNMGTFTGSPYGNSLSNPTVPALTGGTLLKLQVLGLGLASVNLSNVAAVSVLGSSGSAELFGPPYPTSPDTVGNTYSVTNTIDSLNNNFLSNINCSPLNICQLAGNIVSTLSSTLIAPLTTSLVDPLLNNILQAVGINLGQTTVYAANPPFRGAPLIFQAQGGNKP